MKQEENQYNYDVKGQIPQDIPLITLAPEKDFRFKMTFYSNSNQGDGYQLTSNFSTTC
jgi:hypothetical protein